MRNKKSDRSRGLSYIVTPVLFTGYNHDRGNKYFIFCANHETAVKGNVKMDARIEGEVGGLSRSL